MRKPPEAASPALAKEAGAGDRDARTLGGPHVKFCAAIPATAAAGVRLNASQLDARRQAEAQGRELPAMRPITHLTAAAAVLLLIGSITYHTLGYQL